MKLVAPYIVVLHGHGEIYRECMDDLHKSLLKFMKENTPLTAIPSPVNTDYEEFVGWHANLTVHGEIEATE